MKKVGLWLCDNFCKIIEQTVFGMYFRMRFVIKLIVICFKKNTSCSFHMDKRIPVKGIEKDGYRDLRYPRVSAG